MLLLGVPAYFIRPLPYVYGVPYNLTCTTDCGLDKCRWQMSGWVVVHPRNSHSLLDGLDRVVDRRASTVPKFKPGLPPLRPRNSMIAPSLVQTRRMDHWIADSAGGYASHFLTLSLHMGAAKTRRCIAICRVAGLVHCRKYRTSRSDIPVLEYPVRPSLIILALCVISDP